jgi:predicted MPP superfamily phosphohydrolase
VAPAGAPVIVLSHRPTGAAANANLGAAIQLSGHTHGGMMPELSAVTAAANEGFVSGLYRVGNMLFYVSNGTGIWNGFPQRLSAPPEIMLFTLN